MPQISFPFASVIIKAKEFKILGNDKIGRLLASEDAREAASLLAEWGYGGGESESLLQYEALISRELRETYALVRAITPDTQATDLFFLRYDYHNVKVLVKLRETGAAMQEKDLSDAGLFAPSILLRAVQEKKYASLTDEMKRTLAELDKTFAITRDISLADIALDRAYAREAHARIRGKGGFIQKYFALLVDFENILTLLRAREMDLSKDLFVYALLEGGNMSAAALKSAWELPVEDLKCALAKGDAAGSVGAALGVYFASGNLQPLEKVRDDSLLKIAGDAKNDLFSAAPVVYYLLRKEREAKAVKMAMTAKVFGMQADEVQSILAEV